ncbi:MAG: hypothetical protein HKL80_04740, partial [Acidimicrobiales bacterium]|nr:hypothetical protein [Acidimicrobiales bacterium]
HKISAMAKQFVNDSQNGLVKGRVDGLDQDSLRSLANQIMNTPGIRAVILGSSPDGVKASLVVATSGEVDSRAIVKSVGPLIQGGGGGSEKICLAGGKSAERLDEAISQAFSMLA